MEAVGTVSAVIPTRDRPELVVRAVRSVLEQTVPVAEIVVVVDGPDPATVAALQRLGVPDLNLVQRAESAGAGAARQAGVEHASGDLIAFLDDDDRWLPRKIEAQLALLSELPDRHHAVVGTQVHWDTGTEVTCWPLRGPAPGEPIAEYLFVRDRAGEGLLPTPTLMVRRELALRCPFPTHLRTHEEWDWMLDLQDAGAHFHVVLQPLVEVDGRPRRASISTNAGWRASLAWALGRADSLGPKGFSGFLLTEVARTATDNGAGASVQAAIAATALTGRPRPRDVARFLGRPVARATRQRRQ